MTATAAPGPRARQNTDFPFDPFTRRGDSFDTTYYIAKPDENFLRPWLEDPNGKVFVWPLGLEGFSLSIEPSLGIHRFVGDNKVVVDVMHKGEERLTMTGSFPGRSSVDAFRALRDIVYSNTPKGGKILFVPHLLAHAQRVVIARARFDRAEDDRGFDLTYDIEFVRLGFKASVGEEEIEEETIPQPKPPAGATAKKFIVNSRYNTLRKIAALKLGSAARWSSLYTLNAKLFRKLRVPGHKAPDHRLRNGTVIYLP